jgi:hypothetical protein
LVAKVILSFWCVLFVVFAVKRLVFLWQFIWCFCGKIHVCCRFAQAWLQMEQMENSMGCWGNAYAILKTLNVIMEKRASSMARVVGLL